MTPTDADGSARAAVLGRIRRALADVSDGGPHEPGPADAPPARYRTSDGADRGSTLARFAERVAEYKAEVVRVAAADLPSAIASACGSRGLTRLVAPADLPGDWLPGGLEVVRDDGLSFHQIESADAVVTGCALGVAETGTIALDAGPGQGRRALSLLPDCHLCVVREDQVVGLVPEAVAGLHEAAASAGRPITLISGPSATSDIELNRVEGVHGPRALVVFLIG